MGTEDANLVHRCWFCRHLVEATARFEDWNVCASHLYRLVQPDRDEGTTSAMDTWGLGTRWTRRPGRGSLSERYAWAFRHLARRRQHLKEVFKAA